MKEFTAIIEQTGNGILPTAPKFLGQMVRAKLGDEARENLIESIALILEGHREEELRGVPPEAMREYIGNRIQEKPRASVMAHFQSSVREEPSSR